MKPPATHVGIDFGTTNSAVAVSDEEGRVRLLPLPAPGGEATLYWRSVLYFEPDGELTGGAPAIARYLDTGGDGRLLQSIKSYLASAAFTGTIVCGRRWSLEQLIAAYLRELRAAAPLDLGRRCVIGRPVRYWGAEGPEDDARAVARMRAALRGAGFDEVVFEHEPAAAAARYAAGLQEEQLILVADFGGGTADFSVARVGPGRRAGDASAILATGGIGVSGDAFDARIIDAVVAPALGMGTSYRDEMGATTLIPPWLYGRLRRWHYLSFLKEDKTVRLLERIEQGALSPQLVHRLVRIVRDDLGLALHQAVERSKVRLSQGEGDRLRLDEGVGLDLEVSRRDFDGWIAPDLEAIAAVLDDVMARAQVQPGEVARVFATGGTSLVPAVRGLLAARFGADKLVGGDELTSVAWGLAARAREVFR